MTVEAVSGADWSTAGVARIAGFITATTGLHFPPSTRASADLSIRRTMARTKSGDPLEYEALLRADEEAFDSLVSELTVGETYFFREPGQFDFMRTVAIPELLRHKEGGEPLRVWSAGCASGEEPYSLAMLFDQMGVASSAQLLGTDICRARLATARAGRFGGWSLRGVPEDVISRYFRRSDVRYELLHGVRSAVAFRYDNLSDSSTPPRGASGALDLILCRNVLIYLGRNAIRVIAERFYESLADGGWLFLGASDPPMAELAPFEVVVTGAGIAYRRAGVRRRSHGSEEKPAAAAVREPARATGPDRDALPPPGHRPPAPAPRVTPTSAREAAAPRRKSGGRAGDEGHRRAAEPAAPSPADEPQGPDAVATLARELADLGRLDEARRICAAAVRRDPASAELVCLHALILSAAGDAECAVEAARRAIYLDRALAMGHVVLGTAQASLGDLRAARRSLRNAERLLAAAGPDDGFPAGGGEPAGRMLARVRAQLRLLTRSTK